MYGGLAPNQSAENYKQIVSHHYDKAEERRQA
eukprot:COSAG05_NODE_8406_length_706_cov_1.906096_1_plen_31_part_10